MRGKKLRGNGLWESSRIILPEFKEAQINHRRSLGARQRPELDEQRMEELSTAINDAMESYQVVAVRTWAVYEDETHVGVIVAVDAMSQRLKLAAEGEVVWIPLSDILEVGRP